MFLLRACLVWAAQHTITYTRPDGTSYNRSLLKGIPQVLFKNENTPLSITIRFNCPFSTCECTMSDQQRTDFHKSGKQLQTCAFRRKIRFSDSLLFIPASLSKMIDDLHCSATNEAIPLEKAFPSSKRYCDSIQFTPSQFQLFVSCKIPQPYELCTDYDSLLHQVTPPPPAAFKSVLRGIDTISESDHQVFVEAWETLNCTNLLQMMHLYAIGDILMYSDAVTFLFNKIFCLTNLYPSHFATQASLAVQSLLLNGRLPNSPNRRLFLPFLNASTYDLIAGKD